MTEAKRNISNFIKGLQIIEKYIDGEIYPFEIDGFELHFRVDSWKMKEITNIDRAKLEELHFTVKNNDIYTNQYTW